MSASAFTLIQARTAELELRKRVVRTVEELEGAMTRGGERDAVLVVREGVAVPEDSALLNALSAFGTARDKRVFSKFLADTIVIVDVAMDKAVWVNELKSKVAKAPSVLFISGHYPHADDLGMMSRHLRVYGGAVGAVAGPANPAEPAKPAAVRTAAAVAGPAAASVASPTLARRGAAAETARNRRNALLTQEAWFTSQEAAEQARGHTLESNPYEYASRLRREQRLFGARFGGRYLYPAFQFLPDTGEPHPALRDLIPVLPDSNDGWTAAFWLFEPSGRLNGARPVDVFQQDPTVVIAAAQRDFQGDDASW